jgi:hypothetical protein
MDRILSPNRLQRVFQNCRMEARRQCLEAFPFVAEHQSSSARKFKAVLNSFPPGSLVELADSLVIHSFRESFPDARLNARQMQLVEQSSLRFAGMSLAALERWAVCPSDTIDGIAGDLWDASHVDPNRPRASPAALRKAVRACLQDSGLKLTGAPVLQHEIPIDGVRFAVGIEIWSTFLVRVDGRFIDRWGNVGPCIVRMASLLGYPIFNWDEISPDRIGTAAKAIVRELELLTSLVCG